MPTSNPLSRAAARAVYDRLGARQDHQRYEEAPVERLLEWLELETAERVVEFGCGTGRWAAVMLERYPHLRYWGCDLSPTMAALASQRLRPFPQAEVVQSEGEPQLPLAAASCDRIFSTYVLDLLPDDDIAAFLADAQRCLRPGGLMGFAGITWGVTLRSQLTMALWQGVHRLKPELLGGCRPLQLQDWLAPQVIHREVQVVSGVASEILVARR